MDFGFVNKEKGIFARAFPAPSYIAMPAVGIDISDYAIKYIAFERGKTGVELSAHGKVDLPLEVIERGEMKDPKTVVTLLSRIREEHNFEFVHLALPEEHAYLFQINVPKGEKEEVEQMLEFHLKENVPIGAEEAVFDYNILGESNGEWILNVSVYPLAIATQYVGALEEAGYSVLSIEIEGQATARTLVSNTEEAPTLIVDIGRNSANLAITKEGEVTFTATMDIGGDYFTRAIARELNISFQEAEKLKRSHGFRNIPESKMTFNCLLPLMVKFAETMSKHIIYWQMHMGSESGDIAKILLVGGNANIAGLAEFLEATLEVPVEIGDVWQNVFSYEQYIPDIHASSSLEFTTAIGVALRSLYRSG